MYMCSYIHCWICFTQITPLCGFFVEGQYLLLFGLFKGSSWEYLQNFENSSFPFIFSWWANFSAWMSEANGVTHCDTLFILNSQEEQQFWTVSVTLTEKVRFWLWLLSCLTNSVSENGNSRESNSYLFFDWAVNYAMEYKLHADKALRFWILLLLCNFQGEDNAERCLIFNLYF